MDDFNPVVLTASMRESLGSWFWPIVAGAIVLFVLMMLGILKINRAGGSPKRPILAGLVAMLVTAVGLTFLVPAWTLTEFLALSGPLDHAMAFLIACVPGTAVGALVFFAAASYCAARQPAPT